MKIFQLFRFRAVRLALFAALPLAILGPFLFIAGWPDGYDGCQYAVLEDHFREAFLNGKYYPRWLPNCNGGLGYPTFVFYQPGVFYFMLPFSFLPGYPGFTMKLALYVLVLLGGAGAYRLGKEMFGRGAGWFAAALFLCTPYIWQNFFIRGDMSETMAFLLTPWPLYFFLRLEKKLRTGQSPGTMILGIALSLGIITVSHPVVALFYTPTFTLLGLYHLWGHETALRRALLINTLIAGTAGVALAAPYWVTVFKMQHMVNLEAATSGAFSPSQHLNDFSQMFFDKTSTRMVGNEPDQTSFQLGLPHLVAALVGLFLGWRVRLLRAAAVLYLFAIFMMSPPSAWLWDHAGLAQKAQFPWRLLSITAGLQMLCALGCFANPFRTNRFRVGLAVGLLAFVVLWNPQFSTPKFARFDVGDVMQKNRAVERNTWDSFALADEFRPKTARRVRTRQNDPLLVAGSGCTVTELPGSTPYNLRYQLKTSEPVQIVINQYYFPGWVVYSNGVEAPTAMLEQSLTPDGRISVVMPGHGDFVVTATYDGPPGWRVLYSISFLLFGLLVWIGFRRSGS